MKKDVFDRLRSAFRYLLFSMMTFLLVGMLSACTRDENDGNRERPTVTAAPEQSATPMVSPTPTLAATPTPEPDVTPVSDDPTPELTSPEPTSDPEPTIPVFRETFDALKYSGVYMLDTGLDEVSDCDVNCVGNTVIMLYSVITEDYSDNYAYLRSINPDTGEYREVIAGIYNSVCFKSINDELFAIFDSAYGEYTIYDTALNERATLLCGIDYENGSFSSDFKDVWYMNWEDGCLYRRNIETGESEVMYDGVEISGGYINSIAERDYLVIDWYDYDDGPGGTLVYSLKDYEKVLTDGRICTVDENPEGTRCILASEDPYSMEVFDCGLSELFTENEDGEVQLAFEPSARLAVNNTAEFYTYFVDWDNNVLITSNGYYSSSASNSYSNVISEYRAYSLLTGERISEYSIALGTTYIWPALTFDSERDLLFFSTGRGSSLKLYAWDYLNDIADDSEDAFEKFCVIPENIETRRQELENKYNVRMYLGSEVFASGFDYRLTICDNWDQVSEAMDVLDEVLSQYPDGFFEQIKINGIKALGIYLCGGFEKIYSYSADDAIALASYIGYERALALDLNYRYCLERTIVHEISHWIDNKINSEGYFGICTDFEEGWSALNPSGFSYKDSYVSGKTIWKYIFDSADSIENAYFTDEYSQTYATEDRAREFEYLMYPDEDFSDFASSPRIQEKLAYYFACIREAFNDSDWPEKTSWELKLEEYTSPAEEETGETEAETGEAEAETGEAEAETGEAEGETDGTDGETDDIGVEPAA